jgi:cellulose synthase operon protein C
MLGRPESDFCETGQMNGHKDRRTGKSRWNARMHKVSLFVAVPAVVLSIILSYGALAPAKNQNADSPVKPKTTSIVRDAEKALKAGNIQSMLYALGDAVRAAPKDAEARAYHGIALLRSGQEAAAKRELRKASDPLESNVSAVDLAVPYLVQIMLARDETKELLTRFPEPAEGSAGKTTVPILMARAFALQRSGDPGRARAEMERALSLQRDANTLTQSAMLARERGDLALASRQADEATMLSPENENAHNLAVLTKLQIGDHDVALSAADNYVRRFPQSVKAKVKRIQAFLDLNKDASAKQDVDALLKQSPDSPYGAFFRGVLFARAKDFHAAWSEIRFLRPEFIQSAAPIALTVASIGVNSGHAETGRAIMTTFVARNPADRIARLQLAATLLSLNEPRAAVDTLIPIRAPNDPAVHALLAQGYSRLSQYDDAIASLEVAMPSARTNNLFKQQLESQGPVDESDQAIERLRVLLRRDPGNAAAAAPLIAALIATLQWDEALSTADQLAKQAARNPLPAFYKGQILVAQGNLAEAEAAFSQALALDPNFALPLYYRANASGSRGNLERAKRDLH